MKAVMISIHSKWVEKIASGEKTIEVRKTAPKIEIPFKCYIYETKASGGRGKVIGEFVCDKIFNINDWIYADKVAHILTGRSVETNTPIKNICLSYKELEEYLNGKDGYGWHISKLKIYDEPKEISEFKKPCFGRCRDCIYHCVYGCGNCEGVIETAPQSWGYVEV